MTSHTEKAHTTKINHWGRLLQSSSALTSAAILLPSYVILCAGTLQPALAGCMTTGNRIHCTGASYVIDDILAFAPGSDMSIVNDGDAFADGPKGAGLLGTGDRTSITNSGTVRTVSHAGHGIGVRGNDNNLLNTGTIVTSGVSANGMHAEGDRNLLGNKGRIQSGPAGDFSAGIAARGNINRLINHGTISMEGRASSGMRAIGNQNALVNTGTVTSTGAGGTGISVWGNQNAVSNTGIISTTGPSAISVLSSRLGSGATDLTNHNIFVNRGIVRASGDGAVAVGSHLNGSFSIVNEVNGLIVSEKGPAIKLDDHDENSGNDRIENYGRIANLSGGVAVDLGTGDDTFLIRSTSEIDGALEGGKGRDRFVLAGTTSGTFDLSRNDLRNFESHEKAGPATWTIKGTNNRAMAWHIREGELAVTGTMANSSMSVLSGTTLSGDGTVGRIDARPGSTLSPGMGGIGSLAVTGNVLIADGTFYKVDLNSAQRSDKIVASGSAVVQGGTVQVNALPGNYQPGSRWTILSAEGGVNGQFSGAFTNLAFFRPVLSKDGKHIYLSLPRIDEPQQPGDPSNPGNQPSPVGQPTPGGQPGSTPGSAPTPTPTPFDVGTILVHDDLFRAAVLCRLRCSSGGLPSIAASDLVTVDYTADMPVSKGSAARIALAAPQATRDWSMWAKAIGSWGSTEATPNSQSVQRSTTGLVFGADMGLGTPYRLGIAGGYFSTNLDFGSFGSFGSSGDVESLHLGVYGSAAFGALNLRGGLAYAHHEVNTAFNASYASNRFSSSLDSFQAFGELGYEILLSDRVVLEPFAGLAHVHVASSGIEVEGTDAVTGRVHSVDTTYSTLGARLIATMPTEAGLVTFKGMLGWRHAFGDIVPKATFSIAGDSRPLLMTGAPIDKNSLVVEAGLNWEVKKNVTLSVSYSGVMGRRDQEHTVRGGINIRF